MITSRKVLALFVLISAGAVSSAQAGGFNFSLAGAGVLPQSFDMTTGVGTATAKGKFTFGGGALAEVLFSPMVGLEVGGFYMLARKYGLEVSGVDSGMEVDAGKSVYIPAGLRIHFNRYLSLEAGGYYSQALESGDDSLYGVQGGLRINLPLGQKAGFFVEGRYNFGLKELSDVAGVKPSDLVFATAGFTFGGGGK